jgi:hypothetical protein
VRLVDRVLDGLAADRAGSAAGAAAAVVARGAGLIEACDDPRLLALELWPRQRELLHDLEHAREHVWALGRRSGKSTMAAAVLAWDATQRPHLAGRLLPGERRYSIAVATNREQARLVLQRTRALLEGSPLLAGLIEGVSDDRILLRNGSVIAAFPCSARGTRGWPVSALVLDEAAHFVDTDGNASLEAVWQALSPSCLQFGAAARMIVSSTPCGSEGLFAEMWRDGADGRFPDRVAHRFSTAEMNPTIDAEVLAAAEARDPQWVRSEYGAEFVGGAAQYLDPDVILAAVRFPGDLPPEQGYNWVAALDPAFSRDPFALVIVGQDKSDWRRLVVGCVRGFRPGPGGPDSFEESRSTQDWILDEVASLCRYYGARVVTDSHLAPLIQTRLGEQGLPVRVQQLKGASHTEAFLELRARLHAGTVDLPDNSDLIRQLRRLRVHYTSVSRRVENPRERGWHGDLAQALTLGVYEHRRSPNPGAVPSVGGIYRPDWDFPPPSYNDAF